MPARIRFIKSAAGVSVFLCLALTGSLWAKAASPQINPKTNAAKIVINLTQKALHAVSADIAPSNKTFIVLYWAKTDGVVGYNLYRRDESAGGYPSTPVNGSTPIATVKTCAELQALIPEGSPEWDLLTTAFYPPAQPKKQSQSGALQIGPNSIPDMSLPQQKPPAAQLNKQLKANATLANKELATIQPGAFYAVQDPCTALKAGLSPAQEAMFDLIAMSNLKIRLARGLAFLDKSVVVGASYRYELRGVKADGTEVSIATDVPVQAGHFTLPDPPTGITAIAGDARVLVLWNRNTEASTYVVGRSGNKSSGFYQVHTEPVMFDVETDLAGNPITPKRPGLVDYQRWTDDGLPADHSVLMLNGTEIKISGPKNGLQQWYSVASVDILGRRGAWSTDSASATPTDKTAPRTPEDVAVNPVESPDGLIVSWRKVTLDLDGHQELGAVQTYSIYRSEKLADLENVGALTPSSSLCVKSITADPTDPATMTISWKDTDPKLVPAYGEKDFFYRIRCADAQSNYGSSSAAVSGRAPDTTPPGGTKVIAADSHADFIRVMWEANSEPDLAGYQLYVGTCDKGKPYRPTPDPLSGEKAQDRIPCDFALVGEITLAEAKKRREETGRIYFDDYSRPAGSPLCYAYWVRAFDNARNVYPGKNKGGCPEDGEYICQRIYEEIAPPFPVVSGLTARNDEVVVEWLSSPIQDLRAFHVYRSDKEDGAPVFVGCVLNDGTVSSEKWKGLKPKCEDIPAEPNPAAVKGTFEDKTVKPNQVYFYRVSAVDWLGNESESANLLKIPASSTFSYSRDLPKTPAVLPLSGVPAEGCDFTVRWTPAYDPSKFAGFLVFRGMAETGPFRQISPIVTKNEFVDTTVIRGSDYWYRIQSIDKLGKLSQPSPAVQYKY
jgi:fibronectin type 3 domain-containing protein